MAVFVRPDRGNIFKESTNFIPQEGIKLQQLADEKYCKSVAISGSGCLVNKEGELIEDNCLKTGQKAYLSLGSVKVGKYHLLIEPNPEFALQCHLRGHRLLEPSEQREIKYLIKADSPTSLNDFDYLFRLYILD